MTDEQADEINRETIKNIIRLGSHPVESTQEPVPNSDDDWDESDWEGVL